MNKNLIIKHGESLGAKKIMLLNKYDDGSVEVVFICNDFNVCYRVKGSLFHQIYIDYC